MKLALEKKNISGFLRVLNVRQYAPLKKGVT